VLNAVRVQAIARSVSVRNAHQLQNASVRPGTLMMVDRNAKNAPSIALPANQMSAQSAKQGG
jgi:hypothetical protein